MTADWQLAAIERALNGETVELSAEDVSGLLRTAVEYGKGMHTADTTFRLAERMDTLQADVGKIVEFITNLEQAIAASPLAAMMAAPVTPPDIVVPSPAGQLPPGYRPPSFR